MFCAIREKLVSYLIFESGEIEIGEMGSCGEDGSEGLRYDDGDRLLVKREGTPQTKVGPATAKSGNNPVSAFYHHSVSPALADAPLDDGR